MKSLMWNNKDPKNHESVRWTPSGDSFIIGNPAQLSKDLLAKYFRHNNYASFIRQLNLYGFKKKHSNNNEICFSHKYFRKNQP